MGMIVMSLSNIVMTVEKLKGRLYRTCRAEKDYEGMTEIRQ